MKRRCKIDIVAQILQGANGDEANRITKSKIRYKAFVPHLQIQKHLVILVENGLLDYDHIKHDYKITEKGMLFLDIYNKLKEYADSLSLEASCHYFSSPTIKISTANRER
jgi:predicted transcriptional regulator